MFERIVAIVDGSESSQFAIEASITLAREAKSALMFCVTTDPRIVDNGVGESPLDELASELGEDVIAAALRRARDAGIATATGRVFRDDAAHAAAAFARDERASLIFMGLAPRVQILRPVFLSLAGEILQQTDIPLCVVRRPAHGTLRRRVLVPIVGDELSHAGVSYAVELGRRFGATLLFCTIAVAGGEAAARTALDRASAEAADAGVSSTPMLLSDRDVSHAIVHNADVHGCDCIVIASHARTGWPRLVRGSVTEAVFYSSSVPVLIVREPLVPAAAL